MDRILHDGRVSIAGNPDAHIGLNNYPIVTAIDPGEGFRVIFSHGRGAA